MRVLTLILALLILALQYPLWLGKGSWLKAWEVDQELSKQNVENARLKARNASLDAEVKDLKTGYEAIEERARSELGMIKQDEVFFQILEPQKVAPAAVPASGPATAPVSPQNPAANISKK